MMISHAQSSLNEKDLKNLIALSNIQRSYYTGDCNYEKYISKIDSLRTPTLNHISDVLKAKCQKDISLLDAQFLSRPNDDELLLWHAMRKIQSNKSSLQTRSTTDSILAVEALSEKIDNRLLLYRYYYSVYGDFAVIFEGVDLSTYNFILDNLGLLNKTEKAIVFLILFNAIAHGELELNRLNENKNAFLESCEKLPKFNSKPYYHYKYFNYDDFQGVNWWKSNSFNETQISFLYNILIFHYVATFELKNIVEAEEIYFNSILHEPRFFKYTSSKNELQTLYKKSK